LQLVKWSVNIIKKTEDVTYRSNKWCCVSGTEWCGLNSALYTLKKCLN